jgi:phosphoglycerate dehydrogenase-like enzyme
VVLGMGPIGVEIARLLVALGADPVGVRRTPTGDEPCRTVGLDDLDGALAEADALLIALPSTPATRHIVDQRRLALLAPGATVVNVGRGDLVDEAALVDALQRGHIGGAALDVFETEPLADTSPLWDMASVLVTSHVAGLTAGTERRARDQFLDNLGRWLAGEDLCNVVPADRLWSS